MTGRIIHRPEQPHDCDHPDNGSEPTWTVWQCDECGDTWTAWPSASDAIGARNSWNRDLPDPGIPESGYRAWRWPWKRSREVS